MDTRDFPIIKNRGDVDMFVLYSMGYDPTQLGDSIY